MFDRSVAASRRRTVNMDNVDRQPGDWILGSYSFGQLSLLPDHNLLISLRPVGPPSNCNISGRTVLGRASAKAPRDSKHRAGLEGVVVRNRDPEIQIVG